MQARVGEDHGLQIVFQKFLGHARGFVDVAAADTQRAIHDGRIVENESFFRGGSAVRIEDFDFGFEKARSEFPGIGDGCGATNKLRIAAVKTRDAAESAENIAKMATEDAAVGVQFVDDNVAKIFEQARPARVMRENAGVQHVGIGENDLAFFADSFAGIGGRVAIVGENAEAIVETLIQIVEFGKLVLCKGFGGEQVERAGVGIFQDGVQDRQVVAERFSGSGGGDDDDIFSGVDRFCCCGLMSVETANVFGGVSCGEVGMNPGGEVGPLGLARGEVADGGEDFAGVVTRCEGVEDFVDAGDGG